LTLVLVSINVSTAANLEAQKITSENKKKNLEISDIADLKKKINEANQGLADLSDFYQQNPSFTGFLENISGLVPDGIYLNNISINPIEKEYNVFQIYIAGYAPFVEDVILFSDNLKEDKNISEISFPRDTWLENENFLFSVTFKSIIKK
jgi:Tfp pilus assembly protein PilN